MNTLDNSAELPDASTALQILQGAIGQIQFARRYTLDLLAATPQDRWLEIPAGLPTNIVWQVGHLTVSQYGLLLFRLRGRSPEDLTLIPSKFRKAYSRESVPDADPSGQPSANELLERMSQVHELSMQQLDAVTTDVLLEPVEMPYAAYPIKLGAILFCPLHEHLHAGQIGLIRRALGLAPVR
jgi:DinB superfamily